jgi:glucosamine--fructose-6-phosphate aminotransferase (isomerizing)
MQSTVGQLTRQDILQQPDALRAVVEGFARQVKRLDLAGLQSKRDTHWVFTGCGTTYALSLSMAMYYRRYGMQATALPASEIKFYPEIIPPGDVTLLAFSRSGMSSETLWAVEAFRQRRPTGMVVAVTVDAASNLAGCADLTLDVCAARDRSTVETGSFTGMMLTAQLLNAAMLNDPARVIRLESAARKLGDVNLAARELAGRILDEGKFSRFFFLGGGAMYGVCSQASFMIKE